jgi:hypothetical protein
MEMGRMSTVLLAILAGCLGGLAEDWVVGELNEQGWVLYGLDTCPHTRGQKEVLGDAFKDIVYVECSGGCPGFVRSYPTWRNHRTGETFEGVLSLQELRMLASGRPEEISVEIGCGG